MAFNAGSIEGTLTLNRNAFTAGLKAAQAEAEKFAAKKFEVTITPKLDRSGLERIKQQIERVTGNINVKVKLDNTSLQAVKQRIERTVGNINVKTKLDNASLQAVKARIDRSIGSINVKAKLDNSSLQAIKTRINSAVGSINVKAKLDNTSLQAIRARIAAAVGRIDVKAQLEAGSIQAIRARFAALRLTVNVRLRLDASDIARIKMQIALIRPILKVRLDIDRSQISELNSLIGRAGSGFGGAGGQLRAFIGLLPLILTVGAPAITGLIGLLGALTSVIGIAAAGLGAFALVGASVFKTVNEHAKKATDATKGLASAADGVASAQARLAKTVDDAAHQNEEALKRVADARESLSRTVESAARADQAAEERVADTRKNLARTIDSVAQDNVAAQQRIADARQSLSDTIESAARADKAAEEQVQAAEESLAETIQQTARANEAAQERVAAARESLARTVEQAARDEVDAEEKVAKAREDLAATVADVAKANASAQRQVESAERSLLRTQEDAKRAQEDLNQARKDAVDELENLKLSLRGAALSEEQAIIDLADAQERFNQGLKEGASGTELKQLELNVRKAKLSLDEARDSLADLKVKNAEWAKTGIEGSDGVRNAQEKVNAANQDILDSEREVADARKSAADIALEGQKKIQASQEGITKAQKDAADVALENARKIGDAQKDVAKAQKDATQVALDGARDIQKAQQNVIKTQQEAAQTALDGQKSIQRAQEDVAKAQKEATQTAIDGQQRIADAQQEVARAQKEAAQTALDGARDVADAQKAVAEAQQEAARVALENQKQIAEATRALADAQRSYNDALAEMPKKLLPGMQLAEDALNRLKAAYQGLVDRTSPATGRAFASFFDAATAAVNTLDPLVNATAASLERMGRSAQQYFGSADWQNFVNFLAQHVGPTLDKVFAAATNLMGGIKGLVVAFQPLGDWLLDKIVAGLQQFNTWANSLANDPNFKKWLEDVKVDLKLLWEFLVQVVTFIAHLVRDLEPLGRPIMQGLVAVLTFLNSLPPGMLGAIAIGITSIVTALMLGAGGPVALGIGAITAAGAALLYLYQNSDTAKGKMDEFVTWLKATWNPIWETIRTNFEQYIKPAFDRLVAAAKDLWDTLITVGMAIYEKVQPYLQPLADVLTQHVIPAFLDLLTKLTELYTFLVQTFGPAFGDVFGRLIGIATGALEGVSGAIEAFIGLVTGDWQKFGDGLHTIAEGFWTAVAGVFGMNLDQLKEKMHQWDEDIKTAWSDLGTKIEQIWTDIGNWFKGIGTDFLDTVKQKFSEFGPYVQNIIQQAVNGIQTAWRAVANFFREPINWVIRVVINDGILNAWNTVMGWIGAPALTAAPMGELPAFASGGEVKGPGTGTSDSVIARVSAGEYIVPASVAQANLAWLNSLSQFQTGGVVPPPGATLGTGSVGAAPAPGTAATAPSQSWWDRVGANATALFNNLRNYTAMPGLASMLGRAIVGIPEALITKALDTLKNKLTNIFPAAAPGAENLSPYGQDPRFSQVMDSGGILRPRTKAINTSGHAERVLSPKQTQDFNDLIKILNDMFHPTHTKSPTGGDVYHVTLPQGASVRQLANEIAFRKRVASKGRYSPR